METEQIHVSAETYIRLEKALGPRVRFFQNVDTDGDHIESGIMLAHDFLPTLQVIPSGVANGPVDRIVRALLGDF